ncbi:MAG: hypothetical protein ACLUNO_07280 [Oscillospiraceae bacterium]
MLLIARPVSDPPRRFRFGSFADLTAALGCCPEGIDSDVVYIAGGLGAVRARCGDAVLPNALFVSVRRGAPAVQRRNCARTSARHGDVVARRDAIATLRRYFC